MARLLHLILLGLVGAVIVHIAIVLLLPAYTERDVWTQLGARAALYETVGLSEADPDLPVVDNPFLAAVACRFDLSEGMTRLVAQGSVPFWSLSVYDRDGLNVFSLNDRSAGGRGPDIVILTPAQMLEMRQALPSLLERSLFVEADIGEGIAVMRVFVPDESWRKRASAFLDSAACTPL